MHISACIDDVAGWMRLNVYGWTCRRQRSYGWLQVINSTNGLHQLHFESALTLWFRLPSFEISKFLLILTSRCGPTSHHWCRPVFQFCVSSVPFPAKCPDPWTISWLRLLFLVIWTTEMRHLQASVHLLRRLHWLKAKERIDFKLAVLVCKSMHGTAPPYLADELSRSADLQARCRLRSESSSSLVVCLTRLSTVGD